MLWHNERRHAVESRCVHGLSVSVQKRNGERRPLHDFSDPRPSAAHILAKIVRNLVARIQTPVLVLVCECDLKRKPAFNLCGRTEKKLILRRSRDNILPFPQSISLKTI